TTPAMSQITDQLDATGLAPEAPRGVAFAATAAARLPEAVRALEAGGAATALAAALGPQALLLGHGPGAPDVPRREAHYRGHEVYAPAGAPDAAASLLALALLGEEEPAPLAQLPARVAAALSVARAALAADPA